MTDAERLDVLAQCLLVFAERGAAIRAARAAHQNENRADADGAGRDSHDDCTRQAIGG